MQPIHTHKAGKITIKPSAASVVRGSRSAHLTGRAANKSQRARLKAKLRVALAANANCWAAVL